MVLSYRLNMKFNPYKEDEGYFRWLAESSYGDFIVLEEGSVATSTFPPLSFSTMDYYGHIAELIKTYFGKIKCGRTIDCGCGLGRLAFEAALVGNKVIGVDLSENLIKFCVSLQEGGKAIAIEIPRIGHTARRVTLMPPAIYSSAPVVFKVGDIAKLEFDDSSFNFAVSSNVLDRVSEPREATQEMLRVLRPGGVAIVSCPLDWRAAYTPDTALWAATLLDFFPESQWTLLLHREAVDYILRISDRFVERYLCEVIVVEKKQL